MSDSSTPDAPAPSLGEAAASLADEGRRGAVALALTVVTNPGWLQRTDAGLALASAAIIRNAYSDSPKRVYPPPDTHGQAHVVLVDAILRVGHFKPTA